MKIAIYTGSVSNSPFIQNLILGLSDKHTIFLFGRNKYNYSSSKNINFFNRFNNRYLIVCFVLYSLFKLFFKNFNKFKKLIKNLEDIKFSKKFNILNKVLPIILNEPDILHIQWPLSLYHLQYILNIINSKVIVSLRGQQINYSIYIDKEADDLYSIMFEKVDAFHAVSKDISRHLERYQINNNKIKVIYTGVIDSILIDEKIEIGNIQSNLNIIAHAHPLIRKGTFYLLEAMSLLRKENVNFHITLITNTLINNELLQLALELDLSSNLTLIDKLEHSRYIDILRDKDLYICASLSEGIPNILLLK